MHLLGCYLMMFIHNNYGLLVGVKSIITPISQSKFSFNQMLTKSSRLLFFFKIGVLKNLQYSQENTCVGVSF